MRSTSIEPMVVGTSKPSNNGSGPFHRRTFISEQIHILYSKVLSGIQSLRGSPVELYKAYVLKFLDSYAYFSFRLVLTLFLSSDFGYSDVEAGVIYGIWGALITGYGLLTGLVMDYMGVATSLRVGFILSLIGRLGIFMTTSRHMLLANLMVILPLGNCLGIPVLAIGIRRYTNEHNRGVAFGFFYVIMNVAALLSGPIMDMCTIWYSGGEAKQEAQIQQQQEEDGEYYNNNIEEQRDLSVWTLTGYRLVVFTGVIANVLAVFLSWTVREIKVEQQQDSLSNDDSGNNDNVTVVRNRGAGGTDPYQNLKETLKSKNFWRFTCVCFITLNLRMIFTHFDATLPKYMVREFGQNVPKGTIYSINPALIILLVPLVTAATTNVPPLVMIHRGGYVSAMSVFFMAASTSIIACILATITLSIGEAVWSPRLYDYTMAMAEEGREGIFMALSSAPLFLVKLPVGYMSGYLLQKYCPEEGERHSKIMWLIIGLTTLTSPILLTLLWNVVSKRDEDDRTHSVVATVESSSSPSRLSPTTYNRKNSDHTQKERLLSKPPEEGGTALLVARTNTSRRESEIEHLEFT